MASRDFTERTAVDCRGGTLGKEVIGLVRAGRGRAGAAVRGYSGQVHKGERAMRLITCVVVAIILIAMSVQAAEVPTAAGDKAMVFMFQGLDHLGLSGYGSHYGFGMRYYFSDGMALRGGLLFKVNNEKYEPETGDEEKRDVSAYGAEVVLEKHMEGPCASVAPYLGVGGGFSMGEVKYTNWTVTDEYGYEDTIDDTKDKTTGYEAFAVAGFEWGFTNCMTLGGEYRLGFRGETAKREVGGDEQGKCTDTMIGFGTTSVYLSVYW
jgi:hypothetical protein